MCCFPSAVAEGFGGQQPLFLFPGNSYCLLPVPYCLFPDYYISTSIQMSSYRLAFSKLEMST